MRVVSFNIHHGTVARSGPVDPGRLGEVCAAFDADVLALEEVDVGTWRSRGADLATAVAEACAMDHVFGPARRFMGGWYGNALLVRGQISAWTVVPLPKVSVKRCRQEARTAVVAEVRPDALDAATVRVAATHLAVAQEVNGVQLDHLLGVVCDGGMPTMPTVVLGDLNRFPSTVGPAARRAGLAHVPHGPTSPADPPRLVIDHVLVSPDFEVTATEVRSTPMSDHAALLVDLSRASQGRPG
ncbi:MAG: endonuclease/exonuclease/phosphatase family protein [Acidimicrobiales bacterium]